MRDFSDKFIEFFIIFLMVLAVSGVVFVFYVNIQAGVPGSPYRCIRILKTDGTEIILGPDSIRSITFEPGNQEKP